MSGGKSCKCEEFKKDLTERKWVVVDRECNYSAFNGGHYAPSDYSCLHCRVCGALWRTKADYVALVPDGKMKRVIKVGEKLIKPLAPDPVEIEPEPFDPKTEMCKIFGVNPGRSERLEFCMMEKPKNRRERFIYGLFLAVGIVDPPETIYRFHRERCRSASAYSFTTPAGFGYLPDYNPEDAIRIAVPIWAVFIASRCESLYNMAHDKGYREGFGKGYDRGSNQLQRVFDGELSLNEFEKYEWERDRDNNQLHYSWDLKRHGEK